MRIFLIACFLIIAAIAAPADQPIDYKSLNEELDSILKASQDINKMTPNELMALSARVDGTLKQLETLAQKRLGVQVETKPRRVQRSPQEEEQEQQQGAAPPGQGMLSGLAGLGNTSNILQMLSNMFASLGQSQQGQERSQKEELEEDQKIEQ